MGFKAILQFSSPQPVNNAYWIPMKARILSEGSIFIFLSTGTLIHRACHSASLTISLLMVSHFESSPVVFFPETLWGRSWPPPICHPSSCLFLPLPDENPLRRKLSQINTRPLISYHLLPNAAQLYFINMCIVWAELNQTIISTSLRLRLNYRIIGYPSSKEFFRVLPNHLFFQIKINQN